MKREFQTISRPSSNTYNIASKNIYTRYHRKPQVNQATFRANKSYRIETELQEENVNDLITNIYKEKKYKGTLDPTAPNNKNIFVETDSEHRNSNRGQFSRSQKKKSTQLLIAKAESQFPETYNAQNVFKRDGIIKGYYIKIHNQKRNLLSNTVVRNNKAFRNIINTPTVESEGKIIYDYNKGAQTQVRQKKIIDRNFTNQTYNGTIINKEIFKKEIDLDEWPSKEKDQISQRYYRNKNVQIGENIKTDSIDSQNQNINIVQNKSQNTAKIQKMKFPTGIVYTKRNIPEMRTSYSKSNISEMSEDFLNQYKKQQKHEIENNNYIIGYNTSEIASPMAPIEYNNNNELVGTSEEESEKQKELVFYNELDYQNYMNKKIIRTDLYNNDVIENDDGGKVDLYYGIMNNKKDVGTQNKKINVKKNIYISIEDIIVNDMNKLNLIIKLQRFFKSYLYLRELCAMKIQAVWRGANTRKIMDLYNDLDEFIYHLSKVKFNHFNNNFCFFIKQIFNIYKANISNGNKEDEESENNSKEEEENEDENENCMNQISLEEIDQKEEATKYLYKFPEGAYFDPEKLEAENEVDIFYEGSASPYYERKYRNQSGDYERLMRDYDELYQQYNELRQKTSINNIIIKNRSIQRGEKSESKSFIGSNKSDYRFRKIEKNSTNSGDNFSKNRFNSDIRSSTGDNGKNITFSNDYDADLDINRDDDFFNQEISYDDKDNSGSLIRDKKLSYFSIHSDENSKYFDNENPKEREREIREGDINKINISKNSGGSRFNNSSKYTGCSSRGNSKMVSLHRYDKIIKNEDSRSPSIESSNNYIGHHSKTFPRKNKSYKETDNNILIIPKHEEDFNIINTNFFLSPKEKKENKHIKNIRSDIAISPNIKFEDKNWNEIIELIKNEEIEIPTQNSSEKIKKQNKIKETKEIGTEITSELLYKNEPFTNEQFYINKIINKKIPLSMENNVAKVSIIKNKIYSRKLIVKKNEEINIGGIHKKEEKKFYVLEEEKNNEINIDNNNYMKNKLKQIYIQHENELNIEKSKSYKEKEKSFIKNIENKDKELENKNKELDDKIKEIENIKNELKNKVKEIDNLNIEIENKNKELDDKNKEIESKSNELDNKNEELKNENIEIGNKNKEIENKTNEIENKNKEINSQNNEILLLKNEINNKNIEIENKKKNYENIKKEISLLKKDFENKNTELEDKNYLIKLKDNENENHKKEIENKNNEILLLKKELENKNKDIENKNNEMNLKNSENKNYIKEIENKDNEISLLKKEIKNINKSLEDKNNEIKLKDIENENHKNEIENKNNEISSLKKELEIKNNEVEDKNNEIKLKDSENNKHKEEIEIRNNEILLLKKELENKNSEIENKTNEIKLNNIENEKDKKEIENKNKEISSLKKELENKNINIEDKDNEIKSTNSENEKHKKVIENKDIEISSLKKELESKNKQLEDKNNLIKIKDAQNENNNKEIKDKNNEILLLKKELENKNKDIENKNNEMNLKNSENKNYIKEIENKDNEISLLKKEIKNINKSLEDKNNEIKLKDIENENHKNEIENKNNEISSLKKELDTKNNNIENKNKEIKLKNIEKGNYEKEINNKNNEIFLLKKELENKNNKIEEKNKEINQKNIENQNYEKENKNQSNELSLLKAELENKNIEINNKNNETENKNKEISLLKNRLEEVKNELNGPKTFDSKLEINKEILSLNIERTKSKFNEKYLKINKEIFFELEEQKNMDDFRQKLNSLIENKIKKERDWNNLIINKTKKLEINKNEDIIFERNKKMNSLIEDKIKKSKEWNNLVINKINKLEINKPESIYLEINQKLDSLKADKIKKEKEWNNFVINKIKNIELGKNESMDKKNLEDLIESNKKLRSLIEDKAKKEKLKERNNLVINKIKGIEYKNKFNKKINLVINKTKDIECKNTSSKKNNLIINKIRNIELKNDFNKKDKLKEEEVQTEKNKFLDNIQVMPNKQFEIKKIIKFDELDIQSFDIYIRKKEKSSINYKEEKNNEINLLGKSKEELIYEQFKNIQLNLKGKIKEKLVNNESENIQINLLGKSKEELYKYSNKIVPKEKQIYIKGIKKQGIILDSKGTSIGQLELIPKGMITKENQLFIKGNKKLFKLYDSKGKKIEKTLQKSEIIKNIDNCIQFSINRTHKNKNEEINKEKVYSDDNMKDIESRTENDSLIYKINVFTKVEEQKQDNCSIEILNIKEKEYKKKEINKNLCEKKPSINLIEDKKEEFLSNDKEKEINIKKENKNKSDREIKITTKKIYRKNIKLNKFKHFSITSENKLNINGIEKSKPILEEESQDNIGFTIERVNKDNKILDKYKGNEKDRKYLNEMIKSLKVESINLIELKKKENVCEIDKCIQLDINKGENIKEIEQEKEKNKEKQTNLEQKIDNNSFNKKQKININLQPEEQLNNRFTVISSIKLEEKDDKSSENKADNIYKEENKEIYNKIKPKELISKNIDYGDSENNKRNISSININENEDINIEGKYHEPHDREIKISTKKVYRKNILHHKFKNILISSENQLVIKGKKKTNYILEKEIQDNNRFSIEKTIKKIVNNIDNCIQINIVRTNENKKIFKDIREDNQIKENKGLESNIEKEQIEIKENENKFDKNDLINNIKQKSFIQLEPEEQNNNRFTVSTKTKFDKEEENKFNEINTSDNLEKIKNNLILEIIKCEDFNIQKSPKEELKENEKPANNLNKEFNNINSSKREIKITTKKIYRKNIILNKFKNYSIISENKLTIKGKEKNKCIIEIESQKNTFTIEKIIKDEKDRETLDIKDIKKKENLESNKENEPKDISNIKEKNNINLKNLKKNEIIHNIDNCIQINIDRIYENKNNLLDRDSSKNNKKNEDKIKQNENKLLLGTENILRDKDEKEKQLDKNIINSKLEVQKNKELSIKSGEKTNEEKEAQNKLLAINYKEIENIIKEQKKKQLILEIVKNEEININKQQNKQIPIVSTNNEINIKGENKKPIEREIKISTKKVYRKKIKNQFKNISITSENKLNINGKEKIKPTLQKESLDNNKFTIKNIVDIKQKIQNISKNLLIEHLIDEIINTEKDLKKQEIRNIDNCIQISIDRQNKDKIILEKVNNVEIKINPIKKEFVTFIDKTNEFIIEKSKEIPKTIEKTTDTKDLVQKEIKIKTKKVVIKSNMIQYKYKNNLITTENEINIIGKEKSELSFEEESQENNRFSVGKMVEGENKIKEEEKKPNEENEIMDKDFIENKKKLKGKTILKENKKNESIENENIIEGENLMNEGKEQEKENNKEEMNENKDEDIQNNKEVLRRKKFKNEELKITQPITYEILLDEEKIKNKINELIKNNKKEYLKNIKLIKSNENIFIPSSQEREIKIVTKKVLRKKNRKTNKFNDFNATLSSQNQLEIKGKEKKYYNLEKENSNELAIIRNEQYLNEDEINEKLENLKKMKEEIFKDKKENDLIKGTHSIQICNENIIYIRGNGKKFNNIQLQNEDEKNKNSFIIEKDLKTQLLNKLKQLKVQTNISFEVEKIEKRNKYDIYKINSIELLNDNKEISKKKLKENIHKKHENIINIKSHFTINGIKKKKEDNIINSKSQFSINGNKQLKKNIINTKSQFTLSGLAKKLEQNIINTKIQFSINGLNRKPEENIMNRKSQFTINGLVKKPENNIINKKSQFTINEIFKKTNENIINTKSQFTINRINKNQEENIINIKSQFTIIGIKEKSKKDIINTNSQFSINRKVKKQVENIINVKSQFKINGISKKSIELKEKGIQIEHRKDYQSEKTTDTSDLIQKEIIIKTKKIIKKTNNIFKHNKTQNKICYENKINIIGNQKTQIQPSFNKEKLYEDIQQNKFIIKNIYKKENKDMEKEIKKYKIENTNSILSIQNFDLIIEGTNEINSLTMNLNKEEIKNKNNWNKLLKEDIQQNKFIIKRVTKHAFRNKIKDSKKEEKEKVIIKNIDINIKGDENIKKKKTEEISKNKDWKQNLKEDIQQNKFIIKRVSKNIYSKLDKLKDIQNIKSKLEKDIDLKDKKEEKKDNNIIDEEIYKNNEKIKSKDEIKKGINWNQLLKIDGQQYNFLIKRIYKNKNIKLKNLKDIKEDKVEKLPKEKEIQKKEKENYDKDINDGERISDIVQSISKDILMDKEKERRRNWNNELKKDIQQKKFTIERTLEYNKGINNIFKQKRIVGKDNIIVKKINLNINTNKYIQENQLQIQPKYDILNGKYSSNKDKWVNSLKEEIQQSKFIIKKAKVKDNIKKEKELDYQKEKDKQKEINKNEIENNIILYIEKLNDLPLNKNNIIKNWKESVKEEKSDLFNISKQPQKREIRITTKKVIQRKKNIQRKFSDNLSISNVELNIKETIKKFDYSSDNSQIIININKSYTPKKENELIIDKIEDLSINSDRKREIKIKTKKKISKISYIYKRFGKENLKKIDNDENKFTIEKTIDPKKEQELKDKLKKEAENQLKEKMKKEIDDLKEKLQKESEDKLNERLKNEVEKLENKLIKENDEIKQKLINENKELKDKLKKESEEQLQQKINQEIEKLQFNLKKEAEKELIEKFNKEKEEIENKLKNENNKLKNENEEIKNKLDEEKEKEKLKEIEKQNILRRNKPNKNEEFIIEKSYNNKNENNNLYSIEQIQLSIDKLQKQEKELTEKGCQIQDNKPQLKEKSTDTIDLGKKEIKITTKKILRKKNIIRNVFKSNSICSDSKLNIYNRNSLKEIKNIINKVKSFSINKNILDNEKSKINNLSTLEINKNENILIKNNKKLDNYIINKVSNIQLFNDKLQNQGKKITENILGDKNQLFDDKLQKTLEKKTDIDKKVSEEGKTLKLNKNQSETSKSASNNKNKIKNNDNEEDKKEEKEQKHSKRKTNSKKKKKGNNKKKQFKNLVINLDNKFELKNCFDKWNKMAPILLIKNDKNKCINLNQIEKEINKEDKKNGDEFNSFDKENQTNKDLVITEEIIDDNKSKNIIKLDENKNSDSQENKKLKLKYIKKSINIQNLNQNIIEENKVKDYIIKDSENKNKENKSRQDNISNNILNDKNLNNFNILNDEQSKNKNEEEQNIKKKKDEKSSEKDEKPKMKQIIINKKITIISKKGKKKKYDEIKRKLLQKRQLIKYWNLWKKNNFKEKDILNKEKEEKNEEKNIMNDKEQILNEINENNINNQKGKNTKKPFILKINKVSIKKKVLELPKAKIIKQKRENDVKENIMILRNNIMKGNNPLYIGKYFLNWKKEIESEKRLTLGINDVQNIMKRNIVRYLRLHAIILKFKTILFRYAIRRNK